MYKTAWMHNRLAFSPPRRVYVTVQINDRRQHYLQHTLSTHTQSDGYATVSNDYWAPNWTHANETPESTNTMKDEWGRGGALTTQECIAWETRICFHTHAHTRRRSDDRQNNDQRERATSGHMRQPPRDKTKDKTKGARNPDKPKTEPKKDYHRLSVTFFLSSISSFAHSLREKKKIFFFSKPFSVFGR